MHPNNKRPFKTKNTTSQLITTGPPGTNRRPQIKNNMGTYKLKISKTTEETIEISLPIYRRNGNLHFYKVYSPEECIAVTNGALSVGIIIAHSGLAFSGSDDHDCTEAEFLEAFEGAKIRMEAIAKNLRITAPEPETGIKYRGYLIQGNEFRSVKHPESNFTFYNTNDPDEPSGTGEDIEVCKLQIDDLMEDKH